MTVAELKRIATALQSYASVREKASGPESRIGVQVNNGRLKLIAGKTTGGVVVDAGSIEHENVAFSVEARAYLSASKIIKGKLDLGFEVTNDRLAIVTDKGGRVDLRAMEPLREVGFAKKQKAFLATAHVDAKAWGQVARIFDAVQRDIESSPPTMHFYDQQLALTAKSPVKGEMYGTLTVPAERAGEEEVYGSAYMDWWRSLKVLDQDGVIEFGDKGVVARAGNVECFSGPYKVSAWNPRSRTSSSPEHPKPHATLGWNDSGTTSRIGMDRKQLIEAIKGQAPNDELSRVTLQVDINSLKVSAFGAEDGITLPATTEGRGLRSVQSELMLNLLRAFDSKLVELSFGSGPGIRINGEGHDGWLVLLAPVGLVDATV